MLLLIKEFLKEFILGENQQTSNSNQHYPACKECIYEVCLKMCESAIKTNGPLYKHLK